MDKHAANYLKAIQQALSKMRGGLNKGDPLSFRSSLYHLAPKGAIGGGAIGGAVDAVQNFDKLKSGDGKEYYNSILNSILKGGITGAGATMLPSLAVKSVSIPKGTARAMSALGQEDAAVKMKVRDFFKKLKVTTPPGAPIP